MSAIIYPSSYNIEPYKQIKDIIQKPIEPTIVKELEVFTLLLDFLNHDAPPLRFTVLGGSFRAQKDLTLIGLQQRL